MRRPIEPLDPPFCFARSEALSSLHLAPLRETHSILIAHRVLHLLMASAVSASRSAVGSVNGARAGRVHMLLICVLHAFAPFVRALPLSGTISALAEEDLPKSPEDASLWVYLGIAVALVLAGGVFAGLTIAYAHAIPLLQQ